jgi:hypothetical protein
VGAQGGPAVRVPRGHRRGHLGGQRPGERPVGGLDDGHRTPRVTRRRGELGADPARPDDHDVVLLREHGTQPLGVVQGAQQMNPGHSLRARQPDRFRAGRDDQDVVRHRPRGGVQLMVPGAYAEHLAPELQFDAQCLEVDVEGGALRLAEQHGLRERRPVVRLVRFRPDQRHAAGEALFPQGDRGLHAGHSRAHDDDLPCRPLLNPRLLGHLITIDS